MLSNQIQSDFKFSVELVYKIKEIYKKEHGIILSDDEAQEYLHDFVDLFDFVTKKEPIL